MDVPKFLIIACLPIFKFLQIKGTTIVKEEILDHHDFKFSEILAQKLRYSFQTIWPSGGKNGVLCQMTIDGQG